MQSGNEFALEGDPLYNFADNSKYRGTWDTWLRDTANAESTEHLLWICRSIRNFTTDAKCITCRDHSHKYVGENPPEKHVESRQTFLLYLVTFMNFVQKRKHKLLYNPEIIWKYYTTDNREPCIGNDCEKHSESHQPPKIVSRNLTNVVDQHYKQTNIHTRPVTILTHTGSQIRQTRGIPLM